MAQLRTSESASSAAASTRRSQRELRASPAVPPALARRRSRDRGRRHRAAWPRGRQRERGSRRCVPAHRRRRARRVRAPLALARSPESSRGPLRGTLSSTRGHRCRRRAGGCAIRCRGGVGETSTRWRSHPAGSPSRSKRRPGPTTSAISLGCASRWPGCHGAGEDGHAAARLESCVSFVRVASSASRMTCSWSRSTG